MNIDDEFYKYQTKTRCLKSPSEVNDLCEREANRLGKLLKKYLINLRNDPNATVLDAPCGYGNMLFLYSKEKIKCEGLDLDKYQVDLALSVGLNAKTGDIFEIHAAKRYSAISSLDFIEHVEKSSALEALSKFYKMINPGGHLIIRTPCGDSPLGLRDFADDPTHKWIGTSGCIISLLRMVGFRSVEVIEDWPSPVRFKMIRLPISFALRIISKAFLWLIGFGKPKCLSPSMILVAQK